MYPVDPANPLNPGGLGTSQNFTRGCATCFLRPLPYYRQKYETHTVAPQSIKPTKRGKKTYLYSLHEGVFYHLLWQNTSLLTWATPQWTIFLLSRFSCTKYGSKNGALVLSDACSSADTCSITTGLSAYTPSAPSRPFSFYKAKQVVSRGCFTATFFSNIASNDPAATFLIAILQIDLTANWLSASYICRHYGGSKNGIRIRLSKMFLRFSPIKHLPRRLNKEICHAI